MFPLEFVSPAGRSCVPFVLFWRPGVAGIGWEVWFPGPLVSGILSGVSKSSEMYGVVWGDLNLCFVAGGGGVRTSDLTSFPLVS